MSAKPVWANLLQRELPDRHRWLDGFSEPGLDWGLAGGGIDGESATDSPGVDYEPDTESMFQHTAVDLAAQRGCRLDYFIRLVGVADPDAVGIGVLTTPTDGIGQDFSGDTGNSFDLVENR